MKICHLVPGSGGTFYCQNCLRDYALVHELRRQGHDVIMVPLYLPPFGDDAGLSREVPVFFGGVNVYLRERFPLFRKTPRWVDRLFDASWILKLASKREGSTNAADLGPMTLSMLDGGSGTQRKGFDGLIAWLSEQEQPDVIHISNALLLGLAPEIKRALRVPIVCSLQDEEPWLDAMREPHRSQCWEAIARHAEYVEAFIATSQWYGERMRQRIRIPKERLSVVHIGIEIDEREPALQPRPPVLGFLSRLNAAQGFGILTDAFIQLKQDPALKDLRLRATGGCTNADRPFVDKLRAQFGKQGIDDAVDLLPDFQREERMEFLRSLSVLSVPVPHGEAFGTPLIEAMACGVPVVQPAAGAYPEIVNATGGGILYDPNEPGALVESLRSLLRDPGRACELGQRGRAAVCERFSIQRMAQDMVRVYDDCIRAIRS